MNIVLWILQVLLAVAFLAHGWMFLFPSPEIAALMNARSRGGSSSSWASRKWPPGSV